MDFSVENGEGGMSNCFQFKTDDDKTLDYFQRVLFNYLNLGLFFVYFRLFLVTISIIQIEKSVDGLLGAQTHGRMIVGADDTTELWLQPCLIIVTRFLKINYVLQMLTS